MKLDKVAAILMLTLCVLLAGNLWQAVRYEKDDRQPHYYRSDQPFVDKAIFLWSRNTKASPAHAMRSRYPQVIYLGDEVCVALLLKKGSVGGNPAYCFDEKSGKLTKKYEDDQ
jgi:hypothetical protein